MALFDTGHILRGGQFKTTSALQVFWLTRFRGCKVANTLHTPRRNFMGQMTTSTVWILSPKEEDPGRL